MIALIVIGAAAVMALLGWLASRARRRGTAGAALAGAMAAYDEAFHSTAHSAYEEIQSQQETPHPAGVPKRLPRARIRRP